MNAEELEVAIQYGWEQAAANIYHQTGYRATPEEARDMGAVSAMIQKLLRARLDTEQAIIIAPHRWLDRMEAGRPIESLYGMEIHRTNDTDRVRIAFGVEPT